MGPREGWWRVASGGWEGPAAQKAVWPNWQSCSSQGFRSSDDFIGNMCRLYLRVVVILEKN